MKIQQFIHRINSVQLWLTVTLTLALCFVQSSPLHAADPTPVQGAETMRSMLFEIQMDLADDGTTAATTMSQVAAIRNEPWFVAFGEQAPTAAATVQQALDAAQAAAIAGDGPAFAAARTQVWTALLDGAQTIVLQAVAKGDVATAREWLLVREFRQATRFSRPNADATLVLVALEQGKIASEEAVNAVRADLYDTYQARLTEALRNLAVADEQSFSLRRAEHAAAAQGYFAILQPAYLEQRQAAATAALSADFAALTNATLAGDTAAAPLTAQLATISSALDGFRAAPLLPAEQAQRAGQLLRFLNLVGVEYGRGVNNGVVTSDLEMREAATFFSGAQAAFDDLRDLLAARNAEQTAALVAHFTELDNQIQHAISGQEVVAPATVDATIAAINSQLQTTMPEAWLRRDNSADFDVIQTALDNMEAAVASGDYALAESARIDAYAILESGPEARIQAFAAQYKAPLEDLFWYGQGEEAGLAYLINEQADLATIQRSRTALNTQLNAAQAAVSGNSSPFALATNAGIIVFREGLEAVLILASLMAGFKSLEKRRLRRPMWWGAVGAGVASVLTWLLAQGVMTSLARYGEKLEAIVSLIAIAVLLLITNWFFHQNYWTDHIAGLHSKKKGLVGGSAGQWLGLAMLGFTSVYREGFETVLFLQALVLEGGLAIVVLGTLIGLAATMLIGLVIFRLQVRMPYKKMLIVTGVFIGIVLLTMVGNTVHVLQLVGWMPLHPIRFITLPYWSGMWFGLYATWEGVILQVISGAFVIGSYFLAEQMQKRTLKQRTLKQRTQQSGGLPRPATNR